MYKFNTYIEHIEPEFWRELCVKEGKLRHFDKGEGFVFVGHVARYIGYIQSGTMKYVAYSENGAEHVVGMQSDGDFIADFPWSLYGQKARVSIVAVKPCDIYCIPISALKLKMKTEPKWKERIMRTTEAIHSTLYDRYLDLCCKNRNSDMMRWWIVIPTFLNGSRSKISPHSSPSPPHI